MNDVTVILAEASETRSVAWAPSAGLLAAPSFVDLYGDCDASADVEAARLGGFGHVLGPPDGRGAEGPRADALLAGDGPGDSGRSRVLSSGLSGVDSVRTLDRLLAYAAGIDALVLLRASTPSLEDDALVRAGAVAATTGLPAVSPVAQALAVQRITMLAAEHGTRVHLTHLWSAAGVEAVRAAKRLLPSLTASTTVHHLVTPQVVMERLHGPIRFAPVLGDDDDRAALTDALVDGTLDALATDHRPTPLDAAVGPVQTVDVGQVSLGFAYAAAASLLGFEQAARVLAYGPRRVLGIDPAGVVLIDPAGSTVASGARLGSGRNTPHDGVEWPGCVAGLVDDMDLRTR